MKQLKSLLIIFLMVLSPAVWCESTAVPMLQTTANQIIDTLKQNRSVIKQDHAVIYQAVQRYLLPHVDVGGMSRSVLGRNAWNKATANEKKEFTQAFTALVIRTYATPLAEYSGETVKFLPERAASSGRFSRVNSVILRPNGQQIPLSYALVSKNGEWKIYDLSVEGVSLLQSFRTQFAELLRASSMKDLIAEMHTHTKAAS
ncbi:MAG: MlaC/ttg2D family ABC transporter substrate-binding protein [Legionellaceae bacterium]